MSFGAEIAAALASGICTVGAVLDWKHGGFVVGRLRFVACATEDLTLGQLLKATFVAPRPDFVAHFRGGVDVINF